jgi:hypothetical protein
MQGMKQTYIPLHAYKYCLSGRQDIDQEGGRRYNIIRIDHLLREVVVIMETLWTDDIL